MDVTIRRANAHDASEIARVHVATWQSAYKGIVPQPHLDSLDVTAWEQSWKEWLGRTDSSVFVAEEEGALCGFIGGGPLREPVGDCDCEIYAIYVLANMQKRGVGRDLISSLAGDLKKQGFASPAVWVLADNPSCHSYARLGAVLIADKQIEIGGAQLREVAYGWDSMEQLLFPRSRGNAG